MQVGLMLPATYPIASCQQTLRLAEQMQADAVWLPDHMLGFFHPKLWSEAPISQVMPDPDGWLDPFCAAAVLAQQTSLPIGISVVDGTRRRAPDVARSALTVHHSCAGGFRLGVGSGEAESLLPFGYPFERPVGRCEDFLGELRCLLDTGRMPGGGVGRIGIPLETAVGRPGVWVAGHGPRMLRLTGRYGDGWLPAWRMEPAEYAEKKAVVAKHAAEAGRPTPVAGLFVATLVGESRERLAELFEANPIAKLTALFAEGHRWERHGLEHPSGRDSRGLVDVIPHELDADRLREIAPQIPFALIEEYYFLGSAEEIAAQLAVYARAGVDHIVIGNMSGSLGGLAEAEWCGPEIARLRRLLGEL